MRDNAGTVGARDSTRKIEAKVSTEVGEVARGGRVRHGVHVGAMMNVPMLRKCSTVPG